jgi:hypothetical protein
MNKTMGNLILMTLICVAVFIVFMAIRPARAEPLQVLSPEFVGTWCLIKYPGDEYQNLGRQQRHAQQALAVFAQDRRLLLIGSNQDHDRALARALMLAPVGAERGPPHRHRAEKPILTSAPTSQQDQAQHRLGRQRRAAGAFLGQLDLARLTQRLAVCGIFGPDRG